MYISVLQMRDPGRFFKHFEKETHPAQMRNSYILKKRHILPKEEILTYLNSMDTTITRNALSQKRAF